MPIYRRTYLVRQVEIYAFDPPTGMSMEEDWAGFDEALVAHGTPVDAYIETIDDDELTIDEANP